MIHKHLLSLALYVAPLGASADVMLLANRESFTVAPGDTFQLTLTLRIEEQHTVAGLDYFWLAEGGAAGLFTLEARDTTGTPITDAYPFPGNLVLTPLSTNQGGLTEPDTFLSAGDHRLGTFLFSVSPSAPAGDYALGIAPGATWITPEFDEFPFSTVPALQVAVAPVPEPAAMSVFAAAGCLGLAALSMQRRRARLACDPVDKAR